MSDFSKVLTSELEPMWRFALRLTSNSSDAEDLVQRTCVKALENSHQYQEQGRLRSWLFRIEHRIWLNVLRSRQIRHTGSFAKTGAQSGHWNTDDVDAKPSSSQGAAIDDDSPESHLRLHQIYQQVESLPEAQRLVVVLVCVEGFTYDETSQVLEIPIGTVMSRLARARITLGKAILTGTVERQPAEVDGGQQR